MKFIQGKQILLRPLLRQDMTHEYLAWLNSPEINRFSRRRSFPTSEQQLNDYYRQHGDNSLLLAIMCKDHHIGNIQLHKISWVDRKAMLSILIGNSDYWNRGYGSEAWQLLTAHAFTEMNLNRLETGTVNPAMVKLLQKNGWEREGCRRQAFFIENQWHDELLYGLLKEDWLAQRL